MGSKVITNVRHAPNTSTIFANICTTCLVRVCVCTRSDGHLRGDAVPGDGLDAARVLVGGEPRRADAGARVRDAHAVPAATDAAWPAAHVAQLSRLRTSNLFLFLSLRSLSLSFLPRTTRSSHSRALASLSSPSPAD